MSALVSVEKVLREVSFWFRIRSRHNNMGGSEFRYQAKSSEANPTTRSYSCRRTTNVEGAQVCSLLDLRLRTKIGSATRMGGLWRWSTCFILFLYITDGSLNVKSPLLKAISSGRVFAIEGWIPHDQLQKLRVICFQLQKEGFFESSGLSYADTPSAQNITSERLVCDEIPRHYLENESISQLIDQLEKFRIEIAEILCRPSMKSDNLPHESYMSLSSPGTYLRRHMDEKHQELRPANGWALKSRRSISWLLYLNDISWDPSINGGQLRSFPQKARQHPFFYGYCGCHRGNLQIGWLKCGHIVKPVYMESWLQNRQSAKLSDKISQSTNQSNIFDILSTDSSSETANFRITDSTHGIISALYVLSVFKRKVYISNKFIAHDDEAISLDGSPQVDPTQPIISRNGMKKSMNFLDKCYANMKKDYLRGPDVSHNNENYQFSLIENYASWVEDEKGQKHGGRSLPPKYTRSEELIPKGGTLCFFDSVSLPHEVLCTLHGERLAIAGWFHESAKTPKPLSFSEKISSHETETLDRTSHDQNYFSVSHLDVVGNVRSEKMMVAAYRAMSYRSNK